MTVEFVALFSVATNILQIAIHVVIVPIPLVVPHDSTLPEGTRIHGCSSGCCYSQRDRLIRKQRVLVVASRLKVCVEKSILVEAENMNLYSIWKTSSCTRRHTLNNWIGRSGHMCCM